MRKSSLAESLLAHTGDLAPGAGVSHAELDDLRRLVAASLRHGQDPAQIGEAAPVAAAAVAAGVHADLAYLAEHAAGEPVRVARRSSELAAGSLPAWAAGMAPERTLGPFVDSLGQAHWFDFFPLPQVVARVVEAGGEPLVVLPPGARQLAGRRSVTLPAGSVWIRARRLAGGAPADGWCGLRILGGTLSLPPGATLAGGTWTLPAAGNLTLALRLDSPSPAAGPAAGPGAEAARSEARLPATASFAFPPHGTAADTVAPAALSAWGNDFALARTDEPAAYDAVLQRVWIPMRPEGAAGDRFSIAAVAGELFAPGGSAPVAGGAWALAITQAAPENLSTAEGAGALALALGPGLAATWRGLDDPAELGRTFVLVDAASVILLAPAAADRRGSSTFELWQEEAGTAERSHLTASFPRPFSLTLLSQRAGPDGLDAVVATPARVTGAIDRPLTAGGGRIPLAVEGPLGLIQKAAETRIVLGGTPPQDGSAPRPLAVALANALLTVGRPSGLLLNGTLGAATAVDAGTLTLTAPLWQIVPTLPDPYAADFEPRRGRDAPVAGAALRATVRWPEPASPALELTVQAPQSLRELLPQPTREDGNGNFFSLLDVSSGADQLGVHWTMPQQQLMIADLAITAPGGQVATFLLPQFQWEPVHGLPNGRTGDVDEKGLGFTGDGDAATMRVETVHLVPVAPLPVVQELVRACRDERAAAALHFTLPFGLTADAVLEDARYTALPTLELLNVDCGELTGARQIRLTAGRETRRLPGHGPRTRIAIRALLAGSLRQQDYDQPAGRKLQNPLGILGPGFDNAFADRVPIERIDLSGYGASLFSRWVDGFDPEVGFAAVGFDAWHGRTAFERIQMVSFLWPCLARLVRTVVLERQGGGGVLRWDSGWIATTPGLFVDGKGKFTAFHKGLATGMYEVREIRDTDRILTLAGGAQVQAVTYDADLELETVAGRGSVVSGHNAAGRIPLRRQTGYVQLVPQPAPAAAASQQAQLLTPAQFDDLLRQAGPLGGPLDATVRVGGSAQTFRAAGVAAARGGGGAAPQFAVALAGSPELPAKGRWSTVRVDNSSQTVVPVEREMGVPLIRANGGPYRFADPQDLLAPAAAAFDYALLLAHDAQRLLFARPKLEAGAADLTSALPPLLADPYCMLASTGLFPKIDQVIRLPAGTALTAGALELAGGRLQRDAGDLGLTTKQLVDGGLWQESAVFDRASLAIDSLDDWKIRLENVRQRLDFEGLGEIMTVIHDFESTFTNPTQFLSPVVEFGSLLAPAVEVLDLLKALSPSTDGDLGPFKLDASFTGTTARLAATADFELATADGDAVECGMGKVRGNLKIGARLSADLAAAEFHGSAFLEITGSWQQMIFPLIYGGGLLRFSIAADETGKATLELDACAAGSIGGTLIPGLVEVEVTVRYGYYIQLLPDVRPGIVVGMEGRAKLLSGLLAFKFGVEGRVLILPELRNLADSEIRLYGRLRVAGTVTVAWLVHESKSFETDFDVHVNWMTALLVAKAGILPVP